MLQPTEDEEFVVIRAGPPLPLRRPRPLKTNPISPRSSEIHNYDRGSFPFTTLQNETGTNEQAFIPQTISTPSPPSIIRIPSSKVPLKTAALSNIFKLETTAASSPSPTLTTTKISSRSPTPTFTNSTLKSRPPTPSSNVESKVKQYIEQVKKFDDEQRSKIRLNKRDKFLSLEDLYQVTTPVGVRDDQIQMEEKLRETLRIIKEKDEMIEKLRESCHELKIKWADAENRIDDMRFGYGLDSTEQDRRSSFTNNSSHSFYSFTNHKRCVSEINLQAVNKGTNTEAFIIQKPKILVKLMNKSTETDKDALGKENKVPKQKSVGIDTKSHKSRSQITTEADDELCDLDLDLESRESNFDPVLEEKCSNWLEKVQSWKTDPFHNTSLDIKDKDSCGDRDSGFRGSAELDIANKKGASSSRKVECVALKSKEKSFEEEEVSRPKSKSSKKQSSQQVKAIEDETIPVTKSKSPERRLSIPTIAAHFSQKHQQQRQECEFLISSSLTTLTATDIEQSGPPSLQIAPPWYTFTGNVNPNSSTEYEGFPSFSSQRDFYAGPDPRRSVSMDRLNGFHTTAHFDRGQVSGNHRELFKSMDKKFQILHPLIDNATLMALRVKRKSDNLGKILQATKTKAMQCVNVHATNSDDFTSQRFQNTRSSHRQSFS